MLAQQEDTAGEWQKAHVRPEHCREHQHAVLVFQAVMISLLANDLKKSCSPSKSQCIGQSGRERHPALTCCASIEHGSLRTCRMGAWMAVILGPLSSHLVIQILIPVTVYPLNSPGMILHSHRVWCLSAVSFLRSRECHYLHRLLHTCRTGDSCETLWSKMLRWGCRKFCRSHCRCGC